jgi:PAS domain S-box-containing protein
MKLAPRLAIVFLVYAAVLLATVGLLANASGSDSLRAATLSELEGAAGEKEAAMNQWIDEKQGDIALLAADPDIVANGRSLMEAPSGSARARQARAAILAQLMPRRGIEFTEMLFLHPESGTVLAATDVSEEGSSKADRPFFFQARFTVFLQGPYFSPTLGLPTMTAAAPVREPDGRLIGVLAGRLDLNDLNVILGRRTGQHVTDDAYLVNSAGQAVTPMRFVGSPALLEKDLDTEAARLCLTGSSGSVEAADYRGVPVVTVYRWVPERDLCLIVEIEQEEAYAPVRALQARLEAIGAAAVLAAVVLALILARTLAGPIVALQAAAARFGRGELNLRLPDTSRDELGSLARQFNAMASALQRQELHLRQRAASLGEEVQERASALRASEDRLRNTMDTMREGVQIIGFDYRYLYVNDAVAEQGRKSKVELLGRTMMECYPGIDQVPFFANLRECMEKRVPQHLENLFEYPDGSTGCFDLSMQPVAEGVFILSQDITARKRAEAAILESEERYRGLFESMVNGYAYCRMVTENGRPTDFVYLSVNREFEGLTGLRGVEGRMVTDVIPGIRLANPELFEIYGRVAEGGAPERFETYVEPLGRWFDVSVYSPLRGHFVAVFDNITVRKKAEISLQKHAEQVEALNRVAGIVSSSLELDKVYDGFVAEVRRLLPIDRTSITEVDEVGQRWRIVRQWTAVKPSLEPGTWHALRGSFVESAVRSGRPSVESPIDPNDSWIESSLLRAEGMLSRIVAPLLVKGRVIGTVSIASRTASAYNEAHLDVVVPMTGQLALAIENIRLYEAEREHAATLERRVAERTADLEAANQELEAFSYSVSHDLRAPLRAADGFSRILIEDHGESLDAEARRYLEVVRSSTQRMGRLIDELLAFSRLGRQEISRRKVDPAAIARQALAEVQPDGAGPALEVEIGVMPMVDADPGLLRQVYVNLLANAVKFARTRRPARIDVGSRFENGEAVFFVQDNGVGFDMAYAHKLFGVFQRLHRAEDYEGTGVGLAIVQRIVHRHGGRVWAEGTLDQGATFSFTIPDRREG